MTLSCWRRLSRNAYCGSWCSPIGRRCILLILRCAARQTTATAAAATATDSDASASAAFETRWPPVERCAAAVTTSSDYGRPLLRRRRDISGGVFLSSPSRARRWFGCFAHHVRGTRGTMRRSWDCVVGNNVTRRLLDFPPGTIMFSCLVKRTLAKRKQIHPHLTRRLWATRQRRCRQPERGPFTDRRKDLPPRGHPVLLKSAATEAASRRQPLLYSRHPYPQRTFWLFIKDRPKPALLHSIQHK